MTDIIADAIDAGTVAGKRDAGTPANTPVYTIVTQVKSNRVVYFTEDADYAAPTDVDWCYCSNYRGALPKGMTLRNCWRWRFNGGVFTDAGDMQAPKNAKQALIEHNRLALLRILQEKIDLARAQHAPTCLMGDTVRTRKLDEARTFLATPETRSSYPLLEATAVARNVTLEDAAWLIVEQAEETKRMLVETETVREKFSHAIRIAQSETELLQLRDSLLNDVLPGLTQHFKFKVENTQPPKPDAPLPPAQLQHEQARLQVQLREKINDLRSAHVSRYLLDDVILKHKGKLAEAVIAHGGKAPEQLDIGVLAAHADARGMSLLEAAKDVLLELSDTGKVLVETEKTKEKMLKQIAGIVTLRDLNRVSAEIEKL